MSALWYDFDCLDCGGAVSSAERRRLVSRQWPVTLCRACLDAALARRAARKRAREEWEAWLAWDKRARRRRARLALRRRGWAATRARRAEEAVRERAERLRACYAPGKRRGYVYRLYDSSGRLLYVGKTYRVKERLYGTSGHAKTKPWFGEVSRCVVKVYRNEDAALAAEAWAIKRERPVFNLDRPEPWTPRAPRALLTYSGDL